MLETVSKFITPANVTSAVRWVLGLVFGGMISTGKIDPSAVETIVGAVGALLLLAWSYFVHMPKPPQ